MSARLTAPLCALVSALGAAVVVIAYLLTPLAIAIGQFVANGAAAFAAAAGLVAVLGGLVLFILVKTTHKQMEPTRETRNLRSSERMPVDFDVTLDHGERGQAIDLSLGGLAVVVDEGSAGGDLDDTLTVTGVGEHGELVARVVRSEPIFCDGRRRRLLRLQVLAPASPVHASHHAASTMQPT